MDNPTLAFATFLTAAVLFLLMAVYALSQRLLKGAALWVTAFGLSTAGLFLLSRQGDWHPWLTVVLANSLIWGGHWFLAFGLRRFFGLPWAQKRHGVYFAVHVALFIWFGIYDPQTGPRVVALSAGVVLMSVETLLVLWPRSRSYSLVAKLPLLVTLGLNSALYLIRLGAVLFEPNRQALLGSGIGGTLAFSFGLIILIGWGGSILLLHAARVQFDLAQARDELAELNALKDHIFALTAHDLRGPLGNLRQLWGLVLEKAREGTCIDPSEPVYALVDKALDGTQSLVENLFAYAAAQSLRGRIPEGLLDASEVLQVVGYQLESSAQRKDLRLDVQTQPGLLVRVDGESLTIAVRNLVSNALKFSPRGSRVRLESRLEGQEVVITVVDEGLGMSQDLLNRLFSPAAKTSRPGTEGERGSGLGMILVRDLVRNSGGRLDLTSEPGRGTTATIRLPQASA